MLVLSVRGYPAASNKEGAMEQGTTRLQQSATVWIDCTPEEAFAYVADFTTRPAWSPDDMRVLSAPDGPVRVGSRCRTVGFSAVRGGDVEAGPKP